METNSVCPRSRFFFFFVSLLVPQMFFPNLDQWRSLYRFLADNPIVHENGQMLR